MAGAGLGHVRTEQIMAHADRVVAFRLSGLHLRTPQGTPRNASTALWAGQLTSPGRDRTAVSV